jgi:hypothetical protein
MYTTIHDHHVNKCSQGKNQIFFSESCTDITEYTILNILHKVKNEFVKEILCESIFRSFFSHKSSKSNARFLLYSALNT